MVTKKILLFRKIKLFQWNLIKKVYSIDIYIQSEKFQNIYTYISNSVLIRLRLATLLLSRHISIQIVYNTHLFIIKLYLNMAFNYRLTLYKEHSTLISCSYGVVVQGNKINVDNTPLFICYYVAITCYM